MDWYYANKGQQMGPVGDEELSRLAYSGVLTPNSLVWHGGMIDWQPYRVAVGGEASVEYGGFWIRFVAYCLDGILIKAIQAVVLAPLGWHVIERPLSIWSLRDLGELQFSAFAVALCYFVFFWTRYGATPGKMVFGLKVVTAEGGLISPGQAIGRYFSTILSGIIMGIGFLMAGWDEQKRALHDRLAETRVIRERR